MRIDPDTYYRPSAPEMRQLGAVQTLARWRHEGRGPAYTRSGSFALNRESELVLTTGDGRWRVLGATGAPIQIEPAAGPVSVSENGTVRQGNTVVGEISLMTTQDKRSLRKVGGGLFEDVGGKMAAIQGRLASGAVEASNFDPMQGLAAIIETARAYQMNATMIRLQDGATDRAVNTLGRMV